MASCTTGTRLRPHCSQAATATACQWAIFLSARSPLSLSTLRSATSGVMLATPSSVAFSTSQSMRSLAVMPASRCTARGASRSVAWWAPTCTSTSLRPIFSTVASNSPPSPLKSVSASPGCRRSTCTWRAAPGGSAISAPVASGAGQWKRGICYVFNSCLGNMVARRGLFLLEILAIGRCCLPTCGRRQSPPRARCLRSGRAS